MSRDPPERSIGLWKLFYHSHRGVNKRRPYKEEL